MPKAAALLLGDLMDLKQALRKLPQELASEGGEIVMAHANKAAADIVAAYPMGPTGNLKKGVRVEVIDQGRWGTNAQVRSAAPHAHFIEFGTAHRRDPNRPGVDLGALPPRPTFVPITMRERAAMYQDLKELMERHGLEVTGAVR